MNDDFNNPPGYFELGDILIHVFEEYSQFFETCNWYTFNVVKLEFENDEIIGGLEFTLIILGIGIRVRYNHTETETFKDIKSKINEIKEQNVKS